MTRARSLIAAVALLFPLSAGASPATPRPADQEAAQRDKTPPSDGPAADTDASDPDASRNPGDDRPDRPKNRTTDGAPVEHDGAGSAVPGVAAGSDAANTAAKTLADDISEVHSDVRRVIRDPSVENVSALLIPILLAIGRAVFFLVLIAVLAAMVSKWIGALVGGALKRSRLDENLRTLIVRISRYAIWIIAIPIAFAAVGIEATSIAALIGAAGIAIGLGLQGALSNIASGVMLLVLRPIRVGDYVDLHGEIGTVRDIGLFLTVINTFENEVVSIPNSEVFTNKMENLTGNEYRRVEVDVGVAYGTDLQLAERTIRGALETVDGRYDKECAAWLRGYGDSSIEFEAHIYCWSRDFFTVRHKAVLAIDRALKDAGVTIPFPQRTLSGSVGVSRAE